MNLSFKEIVGGDGRSLKAKKNVIASGLFRGADALVYFLLVPLTLGYLNTYEYGIWLTLSSILTWINSFDIGLGNGLRNKLATSIAEGNKEKARIYVSTTFYMLLMLMCVLYAVLYMVVNSIDWYSLLNVSKGTVDNLVEVVQVSLFFFCVNFVFKFIGNVYQGLQLPAFNYLFSLSGNLLSLVVIFIFTKFVVPGTLLWVAVIYSIAPPLVYLMAYPITFNWLFPYLRPSFKFFDRYYLKDLLSLSVVFFILQIASVVLFALSNLLISNLFGPDQVTPYNIAYRYFSIVPTIFIVIVTPMWSATTDAFAKNDNAWIKRSNKKIISLLLVFFALLLVMVAVSDFVYKVWIGSEVKIPFLLSLSMALYIMVYIWSLSFSYFLNGIGRLRLQMYCTLVAAICFYPVCHYLGLFYGLVGVVLGMILVNLPGAIINTIQFKKVFEGNCRGFWDK